MKYEKNVYQNLIKYFMVVFLILSLFIFALYYFVFMQADKSEAYDQFLTLDNTLDEIIAGNDNFLSDNELTIENFIKADDRDFVSAAYKYKNDQGLGLSFLAFDKDKNLTNSLSIKDKLSQANINYTEILIKDFSSDKYYSYMDKVDNASLIYIKEYTNGLLALHINGGDLSKALNKSTKNHILTNKYGRIISKGSNIKEDSRKLDLGKYDSDFIKYEKSKGDFNLYVVREKFFTNDLLWIILGVLSLVSFIYIFVISIVTKRISKNISHSLNELIYQIGLVSKGHSEKIDIKSEDEIKYISDNINTLIDNVKKLEANNISLKYEKKASDVKTMESQFNPHFLYNTLDIISYQMYVDKDSCQRLISNLSQILRYSINNMSFVHLEEDLEYIKLYMEIQKVKHQEMLNFEMDIDENLDRVMVPKLFIQPILENSLKYGFLNTKNLVIRLNIYQKEDQIYIDIGDSGKSLPIETIKHLNKIIEEKSENSFLTDDHHGLENTLKRLKILYKDARLEFLEEDHVLVRIRFRGKDESNNSRR